MSGYTFCLVFLLFILFVVVPFTFGRMGDSEPLEFHRGRALPRRERGAPLRPPRPALSSGERRSTTSCPGSSLPRDVSPLAPTPEKPRSPTIANKERRRA